MTSMKAAVSGPAGFEFAVVARPRPGPAQILVRVRAAALNRADLGALAGEARVLGMECAGEVVETGADVTRFRVGDRVMCSGAAGFAEYAVADWGRAMHLPMDDMTYEQAAGLPLALQTMHDAIVTNGRMRQGDAVLIQGASSGVGLMGLQIAKLSGARTVIGTSTDSARRDRLVEFGASIALDSADPCWPELAVVANGGEGMDLIVDQLAGPLVNQNLAAAAVLGRIVNVGRMAGKQGDFDFDLHSLKRISYIGVTFRTRTVEQVREITARAMADLAPALQRGELSLPIDSVFGLAQLGDAFVRMRANQHFGKIIVVPQHPDNDG
ncbi:MAG: quinone oxidoreductase family protein [Pseudomonas sp.]|uniref:quinone oxidoreductase family protein n=1 Tax=Pseudomonas sp. TaxID=306 RepID=UPI003D6E2E0C